MLDREARQTRRLYSQRNGEMMMNIISYIPVCQRHVGEDGGMEPEESRQLGRLMLPSEFQIQEWSFEGHSLNFRVLREAFPKITPPLRTRTPSVAGGNKGPPFASLPRIIRQSATFKLLRPAAADDFGACFQWTAVRLRAAVQRIA